MEITATPAAWNSDDTAALRAFLETNTGKRLVPRIADDVPPLFESGETNAILIRTGKVAGVQHAITSLLSFAYPALTAGDSTKRPDYPDPEDDRAWDGPKLSDPPSDLGVALPLGEKSDNHTPTP